MEAKFRIGEKVKIANHPDKSKIGKEVEIINLHHSNFNPQRDMWMNGYTMYGMVRNL